MHPEINQYPSRRFYDGKLVPAPAVLARPQPPFRLPYGTYTVFDVDGEERRSGSSLSRHNDSEAEFVIKLVGKLFLSNPGEIPSR